VINPNTINNIRVADINFYRNHEMLPIRTRKDAELRK